MRILHIALSCFYVEGLGYQENLLPKYHSRQGHEVYMLTSTFANSGLGDPNYFDINEYVNRDNVHVIKLQRIERQFLWKKLSFNEYVGVDEALERIQPDVIFMHGIVFLSIKSVTKYLEKNKNVIAFADNHADYYNSPKKSLAAKAFVYFLWRPLLKKASKHIAKFWGTTPWRCTYLNDIYHIPKEKIDLLVMGADSDVLNGIDNSKTRFDIRKRLNIPEDAFVVVSGGKIDRTKNIHLLAEAVSEMREQNVHLVVFGKPDAEMTRVLETCTTDNIHLIGWIASEKVYDYFFASDLAVFPGTHSVLWEQACACRIPCVVKHWEGMEHVNVGGNCAFLDEVTTESLKSAIEELVFTEKYIRMKAVAESEATDIFLYSKIAEKSLTR